MGSTFPENIIDSQEPLDFQQTLKFVLGLDPFLSSTHFQGFDRLRVGVEGPHTHWTSLGWGSARAEDAQGTPNQSHISPSMLSIRR